MKIHRNLYVTYCKYFPAKTAKKIFTAFIIIGIKYEIEEPMKVVNIGVYNSNKNLFHQKNIEIQRQDFLRDNNFAQMNFPSSLIPPSFQVNFGAKIPFAQIRDIPCPCCGIPMLPRKAFEDVTRRANSAQVDKVGAATGILSRYRKNMHPVEKKVFTLINTNNSQNPTFQDFQEILMNLRPEYLAKLKVIQFNILKDIEKLNQDFSNGHKASIQKLIDETRNIIDEDKQDHHFKRKSFIDRIYSGLRDLLKSKTESEDKRIAELIYAKAISLPNSRNNIESFIVKYSRRSHREIAERLLFGSVSTIEHVRAKADKGPNSSFNYLLQCDDCNNTRGRIHFYHWTKYYQSQMPEKLKEYLKKVIEIYKADSVRPREAKIIPKKWQNYPKEIAETIYKQSGKKIDLRDYVAELMK